MTLQNHLPLAKPIFLYDNALNILHQQEKPLGLKNKNLSLAIISYLDVDTSLNEIKKHGYGVHEFDGKLFLALKSKKDPNCTSGLTATIHDNINILYFDESFSDASIKNKIIEMVNTDWILFSSIDNLFKQQDITLINDDIQTQFCHCYNFPKLVGKNCNKLVLNAGLKLQYDNFQISMSRSTADVFYESSIQTQPFYYSGFVDENVFLIKRDVFNHIGNFDENLGLGVEVIDLSIRLQKNGFLIGNARNNFLEYSNDKNTALVKRVNFIDGHILDSVLSNFEEKYNIVLDYEIIESLLKMRLVELEHSVESGSGSFGEPVRIKPKIALIIDAENWAFANIANQMQKNLSDAYDFTIIPTQLIPNLHHILMMTEGCDLVHFFWREFIRAEGSLHYSLYNKELGISDEDFYKRFIAGRVFTTTVYDHLFLTQDEINERQSFYNTKIAGYTVCSSKLLKIYSEIDNYPAPLLVTEDGVDLTLFKPINLSRFDNVESRDLIVGWAGNSKWAGDIEDFKGFHSILKPAIDQLVQEGLNIRLELADRQNGFIPHTEMVNYYAKIDLYVCPSKIEGTPNPVLESMACGVPVISTDVGIVKDAFGTQQQEWILAERSVDALTEKLRSFYFQRQKLIKQLSVENLETIKKWDWAVKSQNFRKFFDSILANASR